MALYALNLFDLADNEDYRAYSRRSVEAVGRHGGVVVALGRLAGAAQGSDTEPRGVMVIVEWPSREAFDAFVADPGHAELHPLRQGGTARYLWWLYERLDDLRPLFADRSATALVVRAERALDAAPEALSALAADAGRLAAWLPGVTEAESTPAGHIARGPYGGGLWYEVERVLEAREPGRRLRWRTVAERVNDAALTDPPAVAAWLELTLAVAPGGGTRAVLESRLLPADEEWAARLREDAPEAEATLADALGALGALAGGR